MRTSALLLALVAAAGAGLLLRPHRPPAPVPASPVPFYSTADFTAEWIPPDSPAYPKIHRIAPFTLRDQEGRVITEQTLRGKIYVANFFFSSCQGICPKMVANLRRLQATFAGDDEVRLVSHTVMPKHDSQAVLRAYAEANGIQSRKWHLLTGDQETLYDLARRSYFAEKRPGLDRSAKEFLHTENMLLVDRQGRIRGVFNATLPAEVDRVMEEIRQLLREP